MSDRSAAISTWRSFHKRKAVDWTKPITLFKPFPASWDLLGRCVTTYYASDKWQKDRSFFERYYHDHNKKTQIWLPKGSEPFLVNSPPPPKQLKAPSSLAVLGYALGFDTVRSDNGKKGELKPLKGSLLVSSPEGRRLYVLEDRQIVALIWGPKLHVESRGIVG